MRMKHLRSFLFFGLVSSVVSSNCNEVNLDARIREREEDQKFHDCRGCKAFETSEENCPLTGFDCDGSQLLKTNVLTSDDHCTCAQMKCADPRAMLMVDGVLANKVVCRNLTWFTPLGDVAESAACAIDCVQCPVLPNVGYDNSPLLDPFVPSAQDGPHHCSGGKLLASNPPIGPIVHREAGVWFACSGGQWRMMNADNSHTDVFYTRLQCIKGQCKPLPYYSSSVCPVKHRCYSPQFLDSDAPNAEKKMTCMTPSALRYTDTLDQIAAPICFLGGWSSYGVNINPDTKVTCVDCPNFLVDDSASVKPERINYGQITCPSKKLHVNIQVCLPVIGCNWLPVPIKTNSIFCDTDFTWDSTGGVLNNFASIKDVVNHNIKWRAECKD
ncbi:hypothetical protein PRIPAC_96618 [Pristionchus pacificus]|uniref:Uncharacterized protein n=1 Tax=Pristionchus pacificus TaxID=54126 RepID=A0A2A6BK19_PRIPA|nr:hypothetical protein PRIPAC_96618 [Pristionchus pacificus]|eukprot:PDM66265.1 hypothetical protein PRIPAC_45490 [Pristionchus pacificus]